MSDSVSAMISFAAMAILFLGVAVYYMELIERGYGSAKTDGSLVALWLVLSMIMGAVFLVSSSFTLAKVVRDNQEQTHVVARLDEALAGDEAGVDALLSAFAAGFGATLEYDAALIVPNASRPASSAMLIVPRPRRPVLPHPLMRAPSPVACKAEQVFS